MYLKLKLTLLTFLLGMVFFIFISCGGNPSLYYPIFLKNRPNLPFPHKIYDKNKLVISIEPCSKNDLEAFADKMGFFTAQKYNRLPDLSYFCFQVENQRSEDLHINLFTSYFEDEKQNKYASLQAKEYKKSYSSAAYYRYEYDNMYSAYIYSSAKPGQREEFRRKSLPNQNVQIKPGEVLRQIIPYQSFSLGHNHYTFKLSLANEAEIEENFFTKVFRE